LACEAAKVSRKTVYRHRLNDPAFAAEWDEAQEEACELSEAIGIQRARERSDLLLMFFLKAQKPEVYREHTADIVKALRDVEKRLARLEGPIGDGTGQAPAGGVSAPAAPGNAGPAQPPTGAGETVPPVA
jgi:hypothetical protein